MKHAYLILAHTDFTLLRMLLEALDDERNDIFIHFDQKVNEIPSLALKKAKLFILEERIDVCWGDLSVTEAELLLFDEALKTGKYTYLHLLSGADLPLKSQDEIHTFFNKHQGKEFIGFSQYDYDEEVDRKVRRIHLFPKEFRSSSIFIRAIRATFLRFQFLLGYRRNRHVDFKKGTQWVSITPEFAKYVISKKEEIRKLYHHTFCSDEIFIQTICWNSGFRKCIFDLNNEGRGCMRMIGWKHGRIWDWTEDDYPELMQSEAMFARKFNSQHIVSLQTQLEKIW
ncbi:MAG: beta-1,6-N-acetylglucosaminyltransferase [Dysgonamonadaceae bacterium]